MFKERKTFIFRLARKYCDEVANPMDMIIFRKMRSVERTRRAIRDGLDDAEEITELFQRDVK